VPEVFRSHLCGLSEPRHRQLESVADVAGFVERGEQGPQRRRRGEGDLTSKIHDDAKIHRRAAPAMVRRGLDPDLKQGSLTTFRTATVAVEVDRERFVLRGVEGLTHRADRVMETLLGESGRSQQGAARSHQSRLQQPQRGITG
jgi:hypothetical protein